MKIFKTVSITGISATILLGSSVVFAQEEVSARNPDIMGGDAVCTENENGERRCVGAGRSFVRWRKGPVQYSQGTPFENDENKDMVIDDSAMWNGNLLAVHGNFEVLDKPTPHFSASSGELIRKMDRAKRNVTRRSSVRNRSEMTCTPRTVVVLESGLRQERSRTCSRGSTQGRHPHKEF